MNDLKGGGEFAAHGAWNLVEHGGGVTDSKELEFSADLFLGDVHPCHLDECAPGAFDEAVGGLSARICRDDLTFVLEDSSEGLAANDYGVKVGVEVLWKAAGASLECFEGGNYARRSERGKTVNPAVSSC